MSAITRYYVTVRGKLVDEHSPEAEYGTVGCAVVLATAYDALVQRLRDVEGALRGLVDKLSNPKTKEGIRSAFMLAQVHGFTYMGPSWEPELEYAAKVLKAPTSQGWTSERSTVEG